MEKLFVADDKVVNQALVKKINGVLLTQLLLVAKIETSSAKEDIIVVTDRDSLTLFNRRYNDIFRGKSLVTVKFQKTPVVS